MRPEKLIAWTTGGLTLLLAVFSFVLSFNALTDLAAQHSISIPPLFPLMVEAGVVIFSLNALYRSLHGEPARWQWTLIIGSSLLAGMFNTLHANTDLVSRAMAAMPSLFLLLSFETFLGQVKHAVRRNDVIKTLADLDAELETKHSENVNLDGKLEAKRRELDDIIAQIYRLRFDLKSEKSPIFNTSNQDLLNAKQAAKQDRLNKLLDILDADPDTTLTDAADQVGVSRQTVGKYVNELSEAGLLYKNGNGWEVNR